jgi:antitoxin (DNA-binding transcriptional repressor) of toxin-antitoxin stability system
MRKKIAAGKFKTECLHLMEEIRRTGQHIIVTKRDVPMVEIVPIEEKKYTLAEWLEGTVHIKGDILSPIDEVWDACS